MGSENSSTQLISAKVKIRWDVLCLKLTSLKMMGHLWVGYLRWTVLPQCQCWREFTAPQSSYWLLSHLTSQLSVQTFCVSILHFVVLICLPHFQVFSQDSVFKLPLIVRCIDQRSVSLKLVYIPGSPHYQRVELPAQFLLTLHYTLHSASGLFTFLADL